MDCSSGYFSSLRNETHSICTGNEVLTHACIFVLLLQFLLANLEAVETNKCRSKTKFGHSALSIKDMSVSLVEF